ncbi:DUF535 family protein [Dyella sp. EPa41]|uniref:VirK/YbjX family protein n=1 Tax=Dyella sp. EPa41 TaxID=1561194 RepID=UPI001916804D|nr:DUF535 family protein [Dyella sp. EPa41]
MNERNLLPGEDPLDANLVFAASGCAYAAQRSLERELHLARPERPSAAGQRERAARDGTCSSLWWRSLRGRNDWVGHPAQRAVMAAKYLVRAASLPVQHRRYLAFLASHPLLRACVACDPRLQERHLHRFIHRGWHRATRLRGVQNHYRVLLQRWPESLFESVYVHGRATLGELTLKDGSVLKLHLRPPITMGCEGELSIELGDADGRALYRLVLTVIDENTMAIGCIQGPDGEQARDHVRVLTRQMHGMRPKQLLLELAYALAGQCGIRHILGISNDAHPLHGRTRFVADYDAFWREQGGCSTGDGWFVLPPTLHHRSEAEVESKHRAAFRRRAELRADAVRSLNCALRPVPWWRGTPVEDAEVQSSFPLPDVSEEA